MSDYFRCFEFEKDFAVVNKNLSETFGVKHVLFCMAEEEEEEDEDEAESAVLTSQS